jgi:hypothetical protein
MEKALNGLCLTSMGKGRLEHSKGRHLFNYEALWEEPQTKWSMAFELPIIGQELLAISVRQKEPLRLKVSGTFSRRLKNDIKGINQKKLLKEFYGALGQFLLLMKSPQDYRDSKGWELESREGELLASYDLKKGGEFSLRAYDFSEYYRSMQFVLNGKERISLDFFVSQCSL